MENIFLIGSGRHDLRPHALPRGLSCPGLHAPVSGAEGRVMTIQTDGDRIRAVIDWETSDGTDTVVSTRGLDVREAITDQDREEFRIAWEALQG